MRATYGVDFWRSVDVIECHKNKNDHRMAVLDLTIKFFELVQDLIFKHPFDKYVYLSACQPKKKNTDRWTEGQYIVV